MRLRTSPTICALLLAACLLPSCASRAAETNLLSDPSFESPREKDQFGRVFGRWAGWIYEGECEFRVSPLAHSGRHAVLMRGGSDPKIRIWPGELSLDPGRYRVTAWLRGLDIGTGPYGQNTEFMFAGDYMPLDKGGTFGWTQLTFVGQVTEKGEAVFPSFGLMAPGYLWVDDVTLEKVGPDVPLTPKPVFGREEKPIEPPAQIGDDATRCAECGYRNDPHAPQCYACGEPLTATKKVTTGEPVKLIAGFEPAEKPQNPFDGGAIVADHATQGTRALRIDRRYVSMEAAQNWRGFDYLKADVFTDADRPLQLDIEIRDRQTQDYWTRVNYTTVVPPGASTLVIPTALYVGEKARPGRKLLLDGVTRLVFSIGDQPAAPLYIDNLRLERDTQTEKVLFDGLWAFDLGPPGSPVMEGFTPLDVSRIYSRGRGFGWKNAGFWRVYDVLQPDPLYQDFICVEHGGLAIDVPNGRYHVVVNMDSPSGYWGEYQRYRRRSLILEGVAHTDTMDLAAFREKYFRFWQQEDLPSENTFDKYQVPYFDVKHHEVEVRDGQLNIDFSGENWGCCVSSIIVYPHNQADAGQQFLDFVNDRRRFHFDNAFKRVLPHATGGAVEPTAEERQRGFIAFTRDWMQDVSCNDRPLPGERAGQLTASAFAGEYEPVTVSLLPLGELGQVEVSVSDLTGPAGAIIPATAIDIGYVQHRVARVTMEGSVYTIAPRLIIPRSQFAAPPNIARTAWLTVKTPATAAPGEYRGTLTIATERMGSLSLPLTFTVHQGTLDEVDIPAGPWGHTIDLPWYDEDVAAWNDAMADKSLAKLREYGFTTATGLPHVSLQGFRNGAPVLDFTRADAQMRRFRRHGFQMPVVTYCPFDGLDLYYRDDAAMQAAGFADYSRFVGAVFSAVQRHANLAGWLPVYWNIGDEPVGDDVLRSAENAAAYRAAFPQGPPLFTAASSFQGSDAGDPHFLLSRALDVANWNSHDEAGVRLLQKSGGQWAFYNGGNRWTYGIYMYKAAKQFDMKFRVAWHWNIVAGDPYYALDCREDDYAWCTTSPTGELIPHVQFERFREGLDDYRRLVTLARLMKENPGKPAAAEAQRLIDGILGSFRLGERELPPGQSFDQMRARLDAAIDSLR